MSAINPIQTLDQLIAKAESGNNQFATRIELLHWPRNDLIDRMTRVAKCSKNTSRALCRTSFGLFQIMGDQLMNLGLDISPIEYCASVAKQLEYFKKYCVANHCEYTLGDIINVESDRLDFAKKYNGPGNVDAYAARLIAVYNGH